MTSTSALPLLLPAEFTRTNSYPEWKPQRYLQPPQAPIVDDQRIQDLELAVQRQMLDGKALKKTRPRRTVDYAGGMGRWALFRKLQPNPRYVPYIRPSPPYVIDLLPPKAYPDNASTSLCTKFVHTSTNKIRCPVNAVTWTPEGRRILTGSTSGEFTAWNGLTFNFETILQAHDTAIRALTFNHAGTYIASADQSGIVKYFQPNMNNLTAWAAHREAVRGLSFSPDDARFATASDDSTVRVWSFAESREERVLTGHGWDVKCVEWHPTMGLLVSGSKDNLIKFWDPRTGTALTTLHQHKNTIQALSWAPHGNLLASASRDQTVRVFDIRSMKEWVVLRGHKKEVCSLAWHPVHPILVSGGSEGAILHWDLSSPTAGTPFLPPAPHSHTHSNTSSALAASAAFSAPAPQVPPRATLSQAHDSNVWALTFHPLGHLLVSASNDHTTRFWARERPGDSASSFAPGGAKPSAQPDDDAYDGQDDDDDALAVPGFGSSAAGAWWGAAAAADGVAGTGGAGGLGSAADDVVPGFGVGGGGGGGPGPGSGGGEVPGLGTGGALGSNMSSSADGQGPRGGQQHGDDWAYRRGGGDGGGRGGGAGGYEGGGRSSGGFGGGGGRGSRWGGQGTGTTRRGGGGRY
ncbi:WD40-repeat-containing domain protein [Lactarius quietus]|nr:WD40-repeat-containing domain protein [Lactarius quietus]